MDSLLAGELILLLSSAFCSETDSQLRISMISFSRLASTMVLLFRYWRLPPCLLRCVGVVAPFLFGLFVWRFFNLWSKAPGTTTQELCTSQINYCDDRIGEPVCFLAFASPLATSSPKTVSFIYFLFSSSVVTNSDICCVFSFHSVRRNQIRCLAFFATLFRGHRALLACRVNLPIPGQ